MSRERLLHGSSTAKKPTGLGRCWLRYSSLCHVAILKLAMLGSAFAPDNVMAVSSVEMRSSGVWLAGYYHEPDLENEQEPLVLTMVQTQEQLPLLLAQPNATGLPACLILAWVYICTCLPWRCNDVKL